MIDSYYDEEEAFLRGYLDEEDFLAHYGTPRKSGRYPYGSGENPNQRHRDLLSTISEMKKQGLTDKQIVDGLGLESTTQLRAQKSIAKNALRASDIARAQRMRDVDGMSNVAIGKEMGMPESTIRSLLAEGAKERADMIQNTADMLKSQVDEKGYIDIGGGVENHLGVSQTRLMTAATVLKEQGYALENVQIDQLGAGNNKTTTKVLAPPGTTYKDIVTNKDKIRSIVDSGITSDDGGKSWSGLLPPLQVSTDRIAVRYKEDGGADADGVIYVRPGKDDISLGGAHYAQVRVGVNGTHYLKGMAIYKDDLPDGVDLMFNTNKSDTGNKLDAMKPIAKDAENPFGAMVRQIKVPVEGGGERVTSAMNIVNEEGRWDAWSKNLSSQMLSKQSPALAKQQLDMTYKNRKADLDEIMSLTNPTVRRKLLETYAEEADSAAVHLKAASLPRQRTQVILPVNTLKDNEIFAPNFRPGERVALIRYPHGGTFEIPELVVNNNHPDAVRLIGKGAKDAVGINSKVAERLSGADFDGDTVLVIPNNSNAVKSTRPLEGLKNFDPKTSYAPYDGMKTIDGGTYNATTRKVEYGPKGKDARAKGREMGDVSNLITDMTIKGANTTEIAAAVRHSMVVIDAEKHALNYKESAKQNNIAALKRRYQSDPDNPGSRGASTIISRATSPKNVPERKRTFRVDPETGKKVWTETGATYTDKNGKVIQKTTKSVKLAETDDARTLVSSNRTPVEMVYANHSNSLKALANAARKEAVTTRPIQRSESAAKVYKAEVDKLNADLNIALKNRPLERSAQILAGARVKALRDANPDMPSDELKKIKSMALIEARSRVNPQGKQLVPISDRQWEAIQAGAISNNKLKQILDNADIDQVRQLSMPKPNALMNTAKLQQAQAMMAAGHTQADIADALGVSVSTLKREVGGDGG